MEADSEESGTPRLEALHEPTPIESESTPRRARRGLLISITALLALATGALVITRPWQRESRSQSSKGAEQSAAAPDTPKALKLVLDQLPDAYEMQWMQDPERMSPDEIGTPSQNQVIVLAKPDAKFGSGGWIAVTTRLMDRFERARFDPTGEGQMQTPRKFALGDYSAAVGKTYDGLDNLTYGPVNDGFSVSIAGIGVNQATLTEIAGLVSVDDDGKATVRDSASIKGYSLLGVFNNVWGVGGIAQPNPQSMISVNYGDPTGGSDWIGISNVVSTVDDPLPLARFFTKDPIETTVHGKPAIAGDLSTIQAVGGQPAQVVWVEDGRVVTLSANKATDELVKLAESTRLATEAEWEELWTVWKARQAEMQRAGENQTPTWMIAAADTDNGSTWVAEGGFTDEGKWATSSIYMMSNGGGTMGGGGRPGDDVTFPHIDLLPQQMGMPGATDITIVIGSVEVADADGAMLRFTPTGDGEPIEVPLRMIRQEWPVWSAALAVPGDQEGVVTLVSATGSELSSEEISVIDNGDDVGAEAPAATVAAAVVAG